MEQKFDISSLKEIREKLDELQSIALNNYDDKPEYFDTIDHLCRVAAIFTDIKIQEIERHVETIDPQGYIQAKLAIAYNNMRRYENKKPLTWKL